MQAHLAILLAVIVAGLPLLAIVETDQKALVLQRRQQIVTLWLHQRGEIDRRLDQGTDGANRPHGPVKSGKTCLFTPTSASTSPLSVPVTTTAPCNSLPWAAPRCKRVMPSCRLCSACSCTMGSRVV